MNHTEHPPTVAHVVARERIAPDARITSACVADGELILNVGPHAWHLSPETARRIQLELSIARMEHVMRYGEDAEQ